MKNKNFWPIFNFVVAINNHLSTPLPNFLPLCKRGGEGIYKYGGAKMFPIFPVTCSEPLECQKCNFLNCEAFLSK